MKKIKVVYLSQLKNVEILWPGDIHALAEFILRSNDVTDKVVNAQNPGTIIKSRPTLHGLAKSFGYIAKASKSDVEEKLKAAGLNLNAMVEYDPDKE